MKLAQKTFKRSDYKITSPFGKRNIINTKNGTTSSFHNGTDYGTYNNKWPLYAIDDGIVSKVFIDSYGAKCLYIDYPLLNIKLFYAHLDKIVVKEDEFVTNNTLIGYTGSSGKSTGIHLHLGLKNLNSNKWLDPEGYGVIKEPFLGNRGYLKEGDSGTSVHQLCKFFANNFYGYFKNTKESARIKLLGKNNDGNYFGPHLTKFVSEFQKRTNLETDGCVGPKTLKKLKEYGFNY